MVLLGCNRKGIAYVVEQGQEIEPVALNGVCGFPLKFFGKISYFSLSQFRGSRPDLANIALKAVSLIVTFVIFPKIAAIRYIFKTG